MSVDCPLDCEYLREAHRHEKPQPLDFEALPNKDLQISEEKLRDNEEYLEFVVRAIGEMALAHPAVIDNDVREALEALIRTHRTLQSGLVYESLPANPLAAEIYRVVEAAIAEFARAEAERLGIHKARESTTMGMLVFLQHFEISQNNGRRKSRAFLSTLLDYYSVEPEAVAAKPSSLLLP
jgi:hypothetical protein